LLVTPLDLEPLEARPLLGVLAAPAALWGPGTTTAVTATVSPAKPPSHGTASDPHGTTTDDDDDGDSYPETPTPPGSAGAPGQGTTGTPAKPPYPPGTYPPPAGGPTTGGTGAGGKGEGDEYYPPVTYAIRYAIPQVVLTTLANSRAAAPPQEADPPPPPSPPAEPQTLIAAPRPAEAPPVAPLPARAPDDAGGAVALLPPPEPAGTPERGYPVTQESAPAAAAVAAPVAPPPGSPFGGAPADLATLGKAVDALFAHLDTLGEAFAAAPEWTLVQALAAAAFAAGVGEVVRRQHRRGRRWGGPDAAGDLRWAPAHAFAGGDAS
jgi:hypothetical protein